MDDFWCRRTVISGEVFSEMIRKEESRKEGGVRMNAVEIERMNKNRSDKKRKKERKKERITRDVRRDHRKKEKKDVDDQRESRRVKERVHERSYLVDRGLITSSHFLPCWHLVDSWK